MSIEEKLKEIRLNQKKTLKEVSSTIDVSIGFISRIEICNYDGVDVSEITVNETVGRINENNMRKDIIKDLLKLKPQDGYGIGTFFVEKSKKVMMDIDMNFEEIFEPVIKSLSVIAVKASIFNDLAEEKVENLIGIAVVASNDKISVEVALNDKLIVNSSDKIYILNELEKIKETMTKKLNNIIEKYLEETDDKFEKEVYILFFDNTGEELVYKNFSRQLEPSISTQKAKIREMIADGTMDRIIHKINEELEPLKEDDICVPIVKFGDEIYFDFSIYSPQL